MYSHRQFALHVDVDLHSLFFVYVLISHEPSWQVATNRYLRKIEATELCTDIRIVL